ncbi:MAG: glycosyltransferase, partial [Flavobacteriaceae bacterium]|nr:glycosyltransferase [Flavobacteriaceae bacterium]
MKILFFIEDLGPGGKQRRLVELIKGLSKSEIFEMQLALMDDNIHYRDIFQTGVKIHYIKRRSLKKDPRVFIKFYRIAKKYRPDIINVWGNMSAIYALPAKVLLKIPMANNQIADAGVHTSKSILSHRLTFPFSDKIVANSHAGLKAYNAPSNKSTVIHNGFDFNRISHLRDKNEIKKELNINTKYVVGMAASYMSRKDYTTYIKAANEVVKKNEEITFICVGDGDSTRFSEMVEPENKNKILVLGWKPNVESIINTFDIGVLSTFTEGISNTILEYMALSKPVVATDGGGTKELVVNGVTGFLVKERAPDELLSNILYFIENEDDRINFGKKGKERIEKEFSIDK